MVKLIPLLLASLLLIGCDPQRVKTEAIEVKVPILYCPAPPVIDRPILSIHSMTDEQLKNDGEVAKHWKATAIDLMGYAKELEIGLGTYLDINMSYGELKLKMESIEQSNSTDEK